MHFFGLKESASNCQNDKSILSGTNIFTSRRSTQLQIHDQNKNKYPCLRFFVVWLFFGLIMLLLAVYNSVFEKWTHTSGHIAEVELSKSSYIHPHMYQRQPGLFDDCSALKESNKVLEQKIESLMNFISSQPSFTNSSSSATKTMESIQSTAEIISLNPAPDEATINGDDKNEIVRAFHPTSTRDNGKINEESEKKKIRVKDFSKKCHVDENDVVRTFHEPVECYFERFPDLFSLLLYPTPSMIAKDDDKGVRQTAVTAGHEEIENLFVGMYIDSLVSEKEQQQKEKTDVVIGAGTGAGSGKETGRASKKISVHQFGSPKEKEIRNNNFACPQYSRDFINPSCIITCKDNECSNGKQICEKIPECSYLSINSKGKSRIATLKYKNSPEKDNEKKLTEAGLIKESEQKRNRMYDQCLSMGEMASSRASILAEANTNTNTNTDNKNRDTVYYIPFEEEERAHQVLVKRYKAGYQAKEKNPIPLIFQHIPKSAGTSFCGNLRDKVHLKLPHGNNEFGILGKNCNPYPSDLIDFWYGEDQHKTISKVVDMGIETYGIEVFLGNSLPYNEALLVTFLRNPLDRLLSHYSGFGGNMYNKEEGKPISSFEEFIQRKKGNFLTRHFCGLMDFDFKPFLSLSQKERSNTDTVKRLLKNIRLYVSKLELTERHLTCAKEKIDKFNFVFMTETNDIASPILSKNLNFPHDILVTKYGVIKSSSIERWLQELSYNENPTRGKEYLQLLRKNNAYDIELYFYAMQKTCHSLYTTEVESEAE